VYRALEKPFKYQIKEQLLNYENMSFKLPDVVQVGKERDGVSRILPLQVDWHDVVAVLEGVRDKRSLVLVVQRSVDVFDATEGNGKEGTVVVDLKRV
jgi:hypothetical protein